MKRRRRMYFSAAQLSEIWDRWQAGQSMKSIGRLFDRGSSSIFSIDLPLVAYAHPRADQHQSFMSDGIQPKT